jgi:hypothetical protein
MLPILNRRKSTTVTLAATPYLDDGKYWDEGLDFFHSALALKFGPSQLYGDFEIAQHLGVHRVISDEWLTGLVRTGRAKAVIKPISTAIADPATATGFILKPHPGKWGAIDVPIELQKYDPWFDRDYDNEVDGARMPDLYIDKFFMVAVDEHYIFRRKTRLRPNGRTFTPLSHDELPRYENPAQTRHYEKLAPPDTWQAVIESRLSD